MSWETDARCHQTDPELFFEPSAKAERKAKSICSRCVVRGECLAFALRTKVEFGVWGGMTSKERRRLLRRGALDRNTLELAAAIGA